MSLHYTDRSSRRLSTAMCRANEKEIIETILKLLTCGISFKNHTKRGKGKVSYENR